MKTNVPDRIDVSELIDSMFESWAPYLANYAFHLTNSVESAEDLVQEAFLALFRALREGKQVEHPRAWTLAVVRNLALAAQRNQRRRGEVLTPPADFDFLPGPENESPPDPDELAAYMDLLSKRETEVLLLRIESHRYREIASRLGVSTKTVGTLLARALRKLQAAAGMKGKGETLLKQEEARVVKTLQ